MPIEKVNFNHKAQK